MKYLLPAIVAVFAFAGLAGPSEARMRMRGMSAETFANSIASMDQFEIQSGQLALQKSNNDEIKKFAQRMIDDHTKSTDQLKEALKQANLPEPGTEPNKGHRAFLTKLQNASEAAFDRTYVQDQRKEHRQEVRVLENYSKRGDNESLKQFASSILPMIREHLQMAEGLKIGAVSARR
ncbi:MAG: DUF4142 domain-containing protein [Rhodomicrobium sp.]|nr:DUF4142 domain-containing protein [Rhodomicrobium sp.]